jgi:hypothetical protein
LIDGRYWVRARAGSGGMGAVYRVEHARMGKVAAMKVLHRDQALHPAAVRRFRREVEALSRLDHPHIVQTFDCGEVDGQLYLIMEYVRGEDLATVVWRDGPLAAPRALALAIQVCSALEEAHACGVVHCDLKPDNIVCTPRDESEHAKVLDFGLARLRDGPEPGEPSILAGTPSYMAPEQVRFEGVDPRSDLYGLGATLYRLVTGEAAFDASSPFEVMGRQLTGELVLPSQRAPALRLPAEIDRVVARAMALRPEDRYATAREMRAELEWALEALDCEPQPYSPPGDRDDSLAPVERGEVDAFERRVRWRGLAGRLLSTPLVLAGLALAGWTARSLLHEGPRAVEREPNDRPALAALVPRGLPVQGCIGPPRPDGQPDFDYYRVPAGTGPRALTARVSGLSDVDLVLEVYDDRGRLLAREDAGSTGEAERIGPVDIGPGEAFIRVRPLWIGGAPPGDEESGPYLLSVDWADARPL